MLRNQAQQILEENFSIFLTAAGEENLQKFPNRLCSAFAFMTFRAHFLKNQDINVKRMQDCLSLDYLTLKKMGKCLKEYKKHYKKFFSLSFIEDPAIVEIKKKIASQKVEMLSAPDSKLKIETYNSLRNELDILIKQYLQKNKGLDINLLTKAEELYYYIHTLAAVFDPGINLMVLDSADNPIHQHDFDAIFNAILPEDLHPKTNPLLEEKKETPLKIEKTFDLAFNYTDSEFESLLTNQFHKNTILDNDFIRLSNGKHAISLTYQNGIFTLFDPTEIKIVPYSVSNLLKNIKERFADSIQSTLDTMTLGVVIFSKVEAKSEPTERPNRIQIIEKILEKNPDKDLNATSWSNITAAWIAANYGHADTLNFLSKIKGINLDIPRKDGATPAIMASYHGYEEVIKVLSVKADLNKSNPEGRTPAFFAAQNNHPKILEQLKDAKVDLDTPDNFGITPLFISSQMGHITSVKYLLTNLSVTQINSRVTIKSQFLLDAAIEKKETLDNLFKSKKVKATIANFTPLHIAAFYGHVEVVEALLLGGANPFQTSEYNITPLMLAQEMKQPAVINFLNPQNLLKLAIKNNNVTLIEDLYKKHVPLNKKDDNGQTPLHYAVASKNLAAISTLLDCGASLNIEDMKGETAKDNINTNPAIQAIFILHKLKQYILKEIEINSINQPIIKKILGLLAGARNNQKWVGTLDEIIATIKSKKTLRKLTGISNPKKKKTFGLPKSFFKMFSSDVLFLESRLDDKPQSFHTRKFDGQLDILITNLLTPELNHLIKFELDGDTLWIAVTDSKTNLVQKERVNLLLQGKVIQSFKISNKLLKNYVEYVEKFNLLSKTDLQKIKESKDDPISLNLAFAYSAAIYSLADYEPMVKLMRGDVSFLKEKLQYIEDAEAFNQVCATYLRNILVLNAGLIQLRQTAHISKDAKFASYRVESTTSYVPPSISSIEGFYSTSKAGLKFLQRSINNPIEKHIILIPSTPGIQIDSVSKFPEEKEILIPAGDVIQRQKLGEISGKYILKILPESSKPLITYNEKNNLLDFIEDEFASSNLLMSGDKTITVLPVKNGYIYRIPNASQNHYLLDLTGKKYLIERYLRRNKSEKNISDEIIKTILTIADKQPAMLVSHSETKAAELTPVKLQLNNTAYTLREGQFKDGADVLVLSQFPATAALYHVSEHFFAEDMRFSDEAYFPADAYTIVNDSIIYKSNHGLAHTGRTMDYTLKLAFPFFIGYCKDQNIKNLFKLLQSNHAILNEILIATAFLSVGRDSELGQSDNPNKYTQYREQCATAFLEYVKQKPQYFNEKALVVVDAKGAHTLFNAQERIKVYANCIEYLGDPDYTSKLPIFQREIMLIFTLVHILDSYRCFDVEFVETILSERLQHLVDIKDSGFSLALSIMRQYVTSSLEKTGDRIIGSKKTPNYRHYTEPFIRCSREPNYLLEQLAQLSVPFDQKEIPVKLKRENLSLLADMILRDAEAIDLNLFLLRMLDTPYLYNLIILAAQQPIPFFKTFKSKSKFKMIGSLVEMKADPNFKDKNGRTPLLVAVEQGDAEVVRTLIDKKAEINPKNSKTHSTLDVAIHSQQFDIIKLLEENKATKTLQNLQDLCIHYVKQGNLNLLQELINSNASLAKEILSSQDKNGNNLLNLAASNNQWAIIEWLLEHGVKTKANLNGFDPLMLAAHFEYKQMVKSLLQLDEFSERTLDILIYCCNLKKVTLLVELLADLKLDSPIFRIKVGHSQTLIMLIQNLLIATNLSELNKFKAIHPQLLYAILDHEVLIAKMLNKLFDGIKENNNSIMSEFTAKHLLDFFKSKIMNDTLKINGLDISPINYAVKWSNLRVVDALLEMKPMINETFHTELLACILKNKSTIEGFFYKQLIKYKDYIFENLSDQNASLLADRLFPDFIKSTSCNYSEQIEAVKHTLPPCVLEKIYSKKDSVNSTCLHNSDVLDKTVNLEKFAKTETADSLAIPSTLILPKEEKAPATSSTQPSHLDTGNLDSLKLLGLLPPKLKRSIGIDCPSDLTLFKPKNITPSLIPTEENQDQYSPLEETDLSQISKHNIY
jgi:ankyrin repeat protein